MAQAQPDTLQSYNNELSKCIQDLREKREELNRLIYKEEEDKSKIQKELALLQERLKKVSGKIFFGVNSDDDVYYGTTKSGFVSLSVIVLFDLCQMFFRLSCSQGSSSERVRQNHPGDRGCVHEDYGIFSDVASCA